MKKLLAILLLVCMVFAVASCDGKTTGDETMSDTSSLLQSQTNTQEENTMNYPFEIITAKEPVPATIEIENLGTIELELYPDIAPISVSNFKYLADKGFYDGLIFHRVIEGFMIQGGCPEGTGMGGPGHKIKGEFLQNGVANPLKHEKGVISMARSQMPDSAGSQFFIMHEDASYLDGQYAAFGRVIKGQEIVDKIATSETDYTDRPTTDVVIKTVKVG